MLAKFDGTSRRVVLRAVALALPAWLGGRVAPSARAAEVPDAACPAPAGGTGGYGRQRFAQSFRARHSGLLTRATIQTTISSGSDDYLIEIRKANRKGRPTATVLGSVQVDNIADPPSGQTTTVTANFAPGAPVKKGGRYALVVSGVGGITPIVQTNVDDGCAGSRFEDDDLDGVFVKDPGADIVFAAFVTRA